SAWKFIVSAKAALGMIDAGPTPVAPAANRRARTARTLVFCIQCTLNLAREAELAGSGIPEKPSAAYLLAVLATYPYKRIGETLNSFVVAGPIKIVACNLATLPARPGADVAAQFNILGVCKKARLIGAPGRCCFPAGVEFLERQIFNYAQISACVGKAVTCGKRYNEPAV